MSKPNELKSARQVAEQFLADLPQFQNKNVRLVVGQLGPGGFNTWTEVKIHFLKNGVWDSRWLDNMVGPSIFVTVQEVGAIIERRLYDGVNYEYSHFLVVTPADHDSLNYVETGNPYDGWYTATDHDNCVKWLAENGLQDQVDRSITHA